jgi:hypothetical protein
MTEYENPNYVVEVIQGWLSRNGVGTNPEKQKSIAREIYWVYIDSGLTSQDLVDIENHITTNPFEITEGNIWERLLAYFNNLNYLDFFKRVFNLTPPGLNTSPNACCGKGELWYRLLRPNSTQPNRGDIKDGDKIIELKGNQARISSVNITGKQYRTITQETLGELIQGNLVASGGLRGSQVFEIEKKAYFNHYKTQFSLLSLETRKVAINTILRKMNVDVSLCSAEILDEVCCENYNQQKFIRVTLEDFYTKYKEKQKFDELMFLGDGTNIKIITTKEDLSKLEIYDNFFRINQGGPIGWYVR